MVLALRQVWNLCLSLGVGSGSVALSLTRPTLPLQWALARWHTTEFPIANLKRSVKVFSESEEVLPEES